MSEATTWTIHGFNVWDGGADTTDTLLPYLPSVVKEADYGGSNLITLRCTNKNTLAFLRDVIEPGDFVVAHSNGCLISWELAKEIKLGGVVCINPALRRDNVWPEDLPVLCLYNKKDWTVEFGRMWGRLVSLGGLRPHGWGSAGRHGFTVVQPNVYNLDTAALEEAYPSTGHSGVFKNPAYWGAIISKWIVAKRGY
jgi:pimeloyl-ACP methyl ester carboxylesterase